MKISLKNDYNIYFEQKNVEYKWKKISFIYEAYNLCNYIHINTGHAVYNNCQKILLNDEYYWEGYNTYLKNTINNYITCAKIKKSQITHKPNMKHIIPGGPHERIQADLWEIDKELSEKIKYKFILEIKDCFSK